MAELRPWSGSLVTDLESKMCLAGGLMSPFDGHSSECLALICFASAQDLFRLFSVLDIGGAPSEASLPCAGC